MGKVEYVEGDSVDSGVRIARCSDTDPLVRRVKDGVEPLKECISEDEVQSASALETQVADDEVNSVCIAVNERVERTGEGLRVWRELEGRVANGEEHGLEVGVVLRRDGEQADFLVERRVRCVHVGIVRVVSEKDEGG